MKLIPTRIYSRIIFFLVILLIRLTYARSDGEGFSATKHNQMVKHARLAERIFNLIVSGISKEERDNYKIKVNYRGCELFIRPLLFSEVIMVSGRWEPYVMRVLDEEVRQDDVVVEVGASIGIYAIPLAKRVQKVIAFEPHPRTSEIIEENIKLNDINNIVLIKRIVGESRRKVRYGLASDPYESGVVNFDDSNKSMLDTIETECIDLDSSLDKENRVDWLLIDVEGFEENVLKGARLTLRKYAPRIIFESFSQNIDRAKRVLEEEGYSITQIYNIYYYASIAKGI